MAYLDGYLAYRECYTVTFNEISVFPSYKSHPRNMVQKNMFLTYPGFCFRAVSDLEIRDSFPPLTAMP